MKANIKFILLVAVGVMAGKVITKNLPLNLRRHVS